jgi:glucose-6-phosphate dehydrogenase assembly protein OpcA
VDTALLGQSVDLGKISRELKKLWESTGGTTTRASLVNFVIYSDGEESMEANTHLLYEFTRDHACRAMLVARNRAAKEPGVQAWINAHCHLPRAGAKHVCCEQLTFLINGSSDQLLSNVLFANLDSDLPLYLWWQGELPEPLDAQLLTWVDRLIFDSRDWSAPKTRFAHLHRALHNAGSRLILCDLNWTRSLHLRQAVSQMFDHPDCLPLVGQISKLCLTHAPENASTALLFAAWIASALRWSYVSRTAQSLRFSSHAGEVECELHVAPGAPISECTLMAPNLSVKIQRDPGSPFHQAEVQLPDGRAYTHLLPAGCDDVGNLLDEELTLGGRHQVYLKALRTAEPLWPQ